VSVEDRSGVHPPERCCFCGIALPPFVPGATPRSAHVWCSTKCANEATKEQPGWIAVEDMTPRQYQMLADAFTVRSGN